MSHPIRQRAVRLSGALLALSILACGRAAPPPQVPDRLPASWVQQTPLPAVLAAPPSPVAAAIRALVDGTSLAPSPEESTSLAALYQSSFEPLLWVDASFHPSVSSGEALLAMAGASRDGLDPDDYRAAALLELGVALVGPLSPTPEDVAAFDVGVSLSMMRYLRHLHRGRVDPRAIGFLMNIPKDEHDYAALVRDAALQSRVRATIETVTPPLVQYRLLRAMLPRYRALVEDATLGSFPGSPARSVKPGETAPGLDAVRARLLAFGDLPVTLSSPPNPELYEGDIVEGVKRFQVRHGFEADGVLGRTTWAALAVPVADRLRQIELAMERMRWLPHLGERPFVAVNIPMFRLWGWDHVPETGLPTFEMGVIVGKALDTRTPIFLEEMKYIVFQPYWNVPRSILTNEILPLLRRDLGYLGKHNMEMVDGQSDEARPVAATPENVNRLSRGELRLRQRPGPRNSLGAVKFIFPNDENVYLHSTPAPELFGRARRDFSHGCVRVEDPLALARWALKDQPEWTDEKIAAALKGGVISLRVPLTRPIRVVLYYVTAAVMPKDRTIHFAEDIYKQDPVLSDALAARRTSR